MPEQTRKSARNVLGGELRSCCLAPRTGFYRDGFCRTDEHDAGRHVVCVEVAEAFLEFSKQRGNDLSTPRPEWNFPGLVPGDRWCLCALRWREALEADMAPKVILEACHEMALKYVTLEDLQDYAVCAAH